MQVSKTNRFNPIDYLMKAIGKSREKERVLKLKVNEIADKLNALQEHENGITNDHFPQTTTFTAERIDLIDDGAEE